MKLFYKFITNDSIYSLTVLFAGLSLVLAGSSGGIWLDEAYSMAPIQGSWGELLACASVDSHPPLFFLLEKCWAIVCGDGVFAMKSFSIIPTVLTMLLTAVFLKKAFSKRAAMLFLLVFFASESIVHNSIEIRMYSWAFFFVTMAAISAWYLITTGKALWTVLFLLSVEGGAYTHYYAALVLAIGYLLLFVYTLWYDRGNTVKMIWIAVLAAILYLPWLGVAVKSFISYSEDFWISTLTVGDIFRYAMYVFNSGDRVLSWVLLVTFLSILCVFCTKQKKDRGEWFAFGAFSCILILGCTGIVVSLLTRPLLYDRYLYPTCGLVWFFFAVEGASLKSKRLFYLLCGVLISLGVSTFTATFHKEKKEGREFARFHAYLSERISPDDIFILSPDMGHEMTGTSVYFFRGHAQVYEYQGVWKQLSPVYWRMYGSENISYRALSESQAFSVRRAWVIVPERGMDGKPTNYQLPDEAQAQWCGTFGWALETGRFDLYVSDYPTAFAR